MESIPIARLARHFERIKQLHAWAAEILEVPGNDDQAMYPRSRGKADVIEVFVNRQAIGLFSIRPGWVKRFSAFPPRGGLMFFADPRFSSG